MIERRDRIFHLQNDSASYLFRAAEHGFLEHLYFGPPVSTDDAEAFAVHPGTGWGCSVLYNDADNAASYDILPLEWSGSGRGDYRESPVELRRGGQPLSTEFRFCGAEELERDEMHASLPKSRGGQTLAVTLEDTHAKLRLTLLYGVLPTAMTRRAVLENLGEEPVEIHRLMSQMMDLSGSFTLHSFTGGWIAEARHTRTPVTQTASVLGSTTGSSSNRCNPGFLLADPEATEDSGRVYGFNLLYSGSHYASVQKSLQGRTRVMQGISPVNFAWKLEPGDRFETPQSVFSCSEKGFNGLSEQMHTYILNCLIPPYWNGRSRPVLFNNWEGTMFSFNEQKLLRLARHARRIGCELFVLDDGWFGARNSDSSSLGDYSVNRKKLPGGLSGLAEKLRRQGLQFGLWFEPESVSPDSELYRAHPDWVLSDASGREDLMGRHQLLLDLTRPEVRDYIVKQVSDTLDSAPISYVKWDMNRHSCALGEKQHAYILGLYDILGRIFGPRPQILLESCSSGGNRFDCGMLYFSPQIWCSDDSDAIERLQIQNSLSYLYPQSCFGAHVSAAPNAQTLRHTPLPTRGNVSFFGCLGYELDLELLPPVELAEIRAQIAYYQLHRQTFQFGRMRRNKAPDGALVWQVTGKDETLVGLYHELMHAAPPYETLFVAGLDPQKRYTMTSRPQLLRVGAFGGLLRYVLPVALNPNGLVISTADAHYKMKDGEQTVTASGAAFAAGVALSARYLGTGYDANGRMQSDFGSNIYLVCEEKTGGET